MRTWCAGMRARLIGIRARASGPKCLTASHDGGYGPGSTASRTSGASWPRKRDSAAAECVDDLHAIAAGELVGVVPGARHDVAVDLDRDATTGQTLAF